jgi:hypothetical protein
MGNGSCVRWRVTATLVVIFDLIGCESVVKVNRSLLGTERLHTTPSLNLDDGLWEHVYVGV